MKLLKPCLLCLLIAGLSACGNEPSSKQTIKQTVLKNDKTVSLQGVVSNNKGPIKTGRIEVNSLAGELIAKTTLENSTHYQVQIPAGVSWPLLLNYLPPNTETEKMLSVAIQPSISKYDINPLTTAIAKQAKSLGGYTMSNLTRAAQDGVNIPDANKTSTGFRGDPTSQYGGWH